jgi:hypothetical protein
VMEREERIGINRGLLTMWQIMIKEFIEYTFI